MLAASVLGSSLAFIESSIISLALPSLQSDLAIDAVELQWVVNAYLLTLSSLMLIGGSAGDRLGLRRIYIAGLFLFGLASAACGVVSDPALLIAFRAIQGAGAAFLVPASLALLNVFFAEEDRPRAIGIWAGASALTTAAGPIIGGALVDLFDWRAVFLFIVPLSFLAMGMAAWKVPQRPPRETGALDFVGAGLLMSSLALITYALVGMGETSASAAPLLVGLAAFAGFLVYERSTPKPMLPLGLFASRVFSGANIMTALLYFALGGALYFVPFNLIQVQGYSALQAGAAFLPMTLMLGFGSAVAGEHLKRYPAHVLLAAGAGLTGAGLFLLMLPGTESSYVMHWLPGIAIIGFGMTLCVSPLTTVVMASVDEASSGTASGVNNTAARLASMLAVAMLTVLAVRAFGAALESSLAELRVAEGLSSSLLANAHLLAELVSSPEIVANSAAMEAVRGSYVAAFRMLMGVCAIAAAMAGSVAFLTLKERR